MTLDIRETDPTVETALREWWSVGAAASEERPFPAWPSWEETRVARRRHRADERVVLLTAFRDGGAVASAEVMTFLHENLHLAVVELYVAPAHRRTGIGRELLAAVEDRARDEGRTTVVGTAYAPVGEDSPGLLFAQALGYPVASAEHTKLVDLAAALPAWPDLDAEVTAGIGSYRVEVFEDRVPEARVDDFCDLLSTFVLSVPTGDLDLEDAAWTPGRLHDLERSLAESGRTWVVALALTAAGRVCGFTELGISRHDPGHASVGGTLVLPGHRGHRLGLAMKLASHRRVRALFPACGHVTTGNAGVNAPMNAVNERLGYRIVERALDVQKRL